MDEIESIDTIKNQIAEAITASFSGWDFSYTDKHGGKEESACPWDYRSIVNKYKKGITSLLDMGTGGGEFLSTLDPFPRKTIATESWKPNISVAREKLNPLGIDVVEVEKGIQENKKLPIEENSFDLVINRHENYESAEIYRILNKGGYFITQQVGFRDFEQLRMIFGSLYNRNEQNFTFDDFVNNLEKAGLSIIEKREEVGRNRFYDIRVVVYFLKIIEWDFPDFDPELWYQRLENIHYLIKRDGYFDDICHRFYIVAQKK